MRFRLLTVVMCSIVVVILISLLSSFNLPSFSMTLDKHFGTHDAQTINLESNSTVDLLLYFGYNDSDAGLVTWAHAVNSQRLFKDAVDRKLDFLEADILMRGGVGGVPIMAHPPAVDSDLTLADFLQQSFPLKLGIKLDFKTNEAIRGSVSVLKSYWKRRTNVDGNQMCPFWMNADIVGHGSVGSGKVDADEFLETAGRVTPGATLSVGWNIHADYFKNDGAEESVNRFAYSYSDEDVKRMHYALVQRVSSDRPITFAVWAKFISDSKETLEWLTEQFPGSTLTIWGKEGDATAGELMTVYEILPKSRVFLDLPDVLRNRLLSGDSL